MTKRIFEQDSYAGVRLKIPLVMPDDEPRSRLMILLPGRGYTIDAPLLYYHQVLAWELGYDTLPMQYGFHVAQQSLAIEQIPTIMTETSALLQQYWMHNHMKN